MDDFLVGRPGFLACGDTKTSWLNSHPSSIMISALTSKRSTFSLKACAIENASAMLMPLGLPFCPRRIDCQVFTGLESSGNAAFAKSECVLYFGEGFVISSPIMEHIRFTKHLCSSSPFIVFTYRKSRRKKT